MKTALLDIWQTAIIKAMKAMWSLNSRLFMAFCCLRRFRDVNAYNRPEGFMRIAVIDGQGGGIGRLIVEKLRQSMKNSCYIIALGTNALATSMMLKAGANEGASGENAIVFNTSRVDVIAGSIACVSANAYGGELSPRIADAISGSAARKVFIPLNRQGIYIAGVMDEPLPIQVDRLVEMIENIAR